MNKRILLVLATFAIVFANVLCVSASPISDAKKQKQAAESKLKSINKDIENIEGEKESLEEEAEEYEQQLVDLLLNIQIINSDIETKEIEIEEAKTEYENSLERLDEQKKAMKKRIQYMYEKGETSYIQVLLESKSFSDAVNKSTYSEKLYSYDRYMLYIYEMIKDEVDYKRQYLDNELEELEEIKADAQEQELELQALIDEYSENIENFEEELANAKSKANEYKNQIKKQSDSIKVMEAEEKRKAEEAAKKKAEEEARRKAEEEARRKAEEEERKNSAVNSTESSSDDGSSSSESSSESSLESSEGSSSSSSGGGGGSAKGQEIANFACQFIGNPYVPGGTSLTEGADCSGFTSAVYQNFGISLPRSSSAQAAYGREVSYSEAAPGDIIYYGGHVGIYIGNGQIVHASTQATGIKISNALYRSIITVRRIV